MIIKVQYDARNRTFKLLDPEFKTILEGDGLYDLAIPLDAEDRDEELFATVNTSLAHA